MRGEWEKFKKVSRVCMCGGLKNKNLSGVVAP